MTILNGNLQKDNSEKESQKKNNYEKEKSGKLTNLKKDGSDKESLKK